MGVLLCACHMQWKCTAIEGAFIPLERRLEGVNELREAWPRDAVFMRAPTSHVLHVYAEASHTAALKFKPFTRVSREQEGRDPLFGVDGREWGCVRATPS